MKKIAIIVSHPDDEILSAGGLILKLKDYSPIIIHATDGSYTDYNGNVHRTPEEAHIETYESLLSLGVMPDQIINLGYKTKVVPYNSEIVEKLDKVLSQNEVDSVFTHNPDDSHNDHSNTAKAVFSACRRLPNLFTFEPVFPANSISLFHPQMYVDISDTYSDKVFALKLHESQYKKYGQKWIDSVDALSRMRGIESGCERAEAFCVIKMRINP